MKYNRTKKILIAGVIVCVMMFVLSHTASAFEYKLLEAFPGFFKKGDSPNLPAMILAIYKFGIWTVGIAGLLMMTVGGVMYIGSAGNNAAAESAKKIITDSLLGIVVALGAYLFVYVINPDLVNITISFSKATLKSTETSETSDTTKKETTPTTKTEGACTGTTSGCCKSGTKCADCYNCSDFTNSYANLCYRGASGNTGCKLNSDLAKKLENASLSSVGAEVSEAWPPTVEHGSSCHTNGTCADVRCKKGCANASVAEVKKIYDSLKSAGLSPVFESKNCSAYTAAGVYCKYYSTMTSPSFHVNL